MMKIKLLTTVLIVLAAVGFVMAADVINVDIKGYNDRTAYVGNGAYDVGADAVWIPYSGGFGVPVGSARSEGLTPPVPASQQFLSSVYAAQVWIGDNGLLHSYQYGSGLMDDGFTAASPNEPNISIWGQDAYQGVYDIYVYGRDPGLFRLTRYGVTTTQTVSGDANAGEFKLGQNYVIFSNVDVNNSNPADLYLTYTNKLNALQFVKKKSPFVIEPNSLGLIRIEGGRWDVAGDKNSRGAVETARFGPDTWFDDVNGIGMNVGYLEEQEFMDYDITVNEANEGQYQISLGVLGGPKWPTPSYAHIDPCSTFIYLDGRFIGEVNEIARIDSPAIGESTKVKVNLDEGSHTVRWVLNPPLGGNKNTGFDIAYVKFTKVGDINNINCADVINYGFTLAGDLNGDCTVALDDLALLVDNWLICNNPNPNGCF